MHIIRVNFHLFCNSEMDASHALHQEIRELLQASFVYIHKLPAMFLRLRFNHMLKLQQQC